MSKGKRHQKKYSFQKIVRTVRNFFLNLFRKIGRGIYFGYQYLKKLPRKTLLIGIASVSAVLMAVIIILLASPRKKTAVTADPVGETVFASGDPDPAAQSFSGNGTDVLLGDDTGGDSLSGGNGDASGDPSSPETAEDTFSKLDEGDRSPVVAQIQERLMDLGYMDSDEPTEYYGSITERAVKTFQSHNGLSSDGICGSETYYLLFSDDAKKYVMQLGDSGDDVEGVQQRLYELGYVTTKSNITGTFGDLTQSAVEDFQSRNNLKSDGKVGYNTLEKLFSENPVSKCYSIGDKDDVIKQVQEKLKKLKYYSGSATGEYTKATATAVRKFQQNNDLVVDGTLGPSTKSAILSSHAQAYVMQIGESGSDVKKVQTRLAKLNYLRSANVTGYFGEKTAEAVMAFQERNKLHADGKVGTGTYNSLFSSSAKKAKTVTPSATPSGGSASGGGSSGSSGGSSSPSSGKGVEKLIEIAQSKKGCRYVSGAKGPNSFDCSGFVYYCLKESGVKISYMTSIGWRTTNRFTRIDSLSNCKRGDILVFSGSSMAAGHVGIYLGSGSMIDAGSSAGCVRITSTVLSGSYWPSHFLMAYRVF